MYQKLKYKKQILFEFIDDLNQSLIDESKIEIVEEVLIHNKKKNVNDNSEKTKINKSLYSDDIDEESDEEEHNHDIYYALYGTNVPVEIFVHHFQTKLKKFNSKIEDSQKFEVDKDKLSDNEDQESQIGLTDANEENDEDLLVFQKELLIHDNHYKRLIRKLLFYKFQKMGIWARQFFSQDNKHIFMLLKLQGIFFNNLKNIN